MEKTMMYPEPNTNQNIHVADTIPPPSCDDTDQHIRLDIDPDDLDGSVIILDDDGYPD